MKQELDWHSLQVAAVKHAGHLPAQSSQLLGYLVFQVLSLGGKERAARAVHATLTCPSPIPSRGCSHRPSRGCSLPCTSHSA